MAKHAKPSFSYLTHIAATPDSVWRALTDGVLTRQYLVRAARRIRLEGRIAGDLLVSVR